MNKKQAFSLALASITLGLTACGGTDGVPATATGSGTSTTAPITPAAVACTAPDVNELVQATYQGSAFASVCLPATSGSSRYDLKFYGASSSAALYKMDFTDASCTTGAIEGASVFTNGNVNISSNTTTVAALGADGVTPVTGSGRTVTLVLHPVDGSFPAGTPLITSGAYVLCKTTPPSTTTMRVVQSFNGSTRQFTPTFVLRSSSANSNAINTGFGFDGNGQDFQFVVN